MSQAKKSAKPEVQVKHPFSINEIWKVRIGGKSMLSSERTLRILAATDKTVTVGELPFATFTPELPLENVEFLEKVVLD